MFAGSILDNRLAFVNAVMLRAHLIGKDRDSNVFKSAIGVLNQIANKH